MSKAEDSIDQTALLDALSLRLPGWTIEPLPFDADKGGQLVCPEKRDDHYLLRIRTASRGRVTADLVSCGDGAVLLREKIAVRSGEQEAPRRLAVLVPMAFDAEENEESRDDAQHRETAKTTGSMARDRLMGTIGLAPGLTVAPSQPEAVFTGRTDVGVLFVNGLALRIGIEASPPYVGVAEKKNANESDAIEISVMDVAFWLGALYRFDLGRRWFLELGLGLKYTHAITKDLTADKYEIDETNPVSRGAAIGLVGGGVMIRRWVSVFAELSPTLFFGRRTYKVRGADAVDLGYGTIGFGLGVRFYL